MISAGTPRASSRAWCILWPGYRPHLVIEVDALFGKRIGPASGRSLFPLCAKGIDVRVFGRHLNLRERRKLPPLRMICSRQQRWSSRLNPFNIQAKIKRCAKPRKTHYPQAFPPHDPSNAPTRSREDPKKGINRVNRDPQTCRSSLTACCMTWEFYFASRVFSPSAPARTSVLVRAGLVPRSPTGVVPASSISPFIALPPCGPDAGSLVRDRGETRRSHPSPDRARPETGRSDRKRLRADASSPVGRDPGRVHLAG